MPNPIPSKARDILYLACILAAAAVINAPDIIVAVQTGDWSGAASKLSATLMLLGGIIAKQNLSPDLPILTAEVEPAEDVPEL